MSTNQEMIGRDDVDDLEAILAITNSDVDAVVHTVQAESDAIFTWDYERSRPALIKLYEKAKTSQWNAERPALVHRGGPGRGGAGQPGRDAPPVRSGPRPVGDLLRRLERGRVDPARHRVPELDV